MQERFSTADDTWFEGYWKKIIVPGEKRLCATCCPEERGELFECRSCKEEKPQAAYSESRWQHRLNPNRRTACLVCEEAEQGRKSNAEWQCHRCGEWKVKAAYSDSQYHNRTQPGREAICLSCEEDRPMHVCGLCKKSKAESEYFPATWRNRTREGRRSLCKECANPKCTAQNCPTCPVCRDPQKKSNHKCVGAIQPLLHAKQLPQTLEEVQQFLCSRCRPITCRCGNTMPKSRQKKLSKIDAEAAYVCVDCQNRALHESDKRRSLRG